MTKPTFIDPFDNAESTKPAFVDPFETDAATSKPEPKSGTIRRAIGDTALTALKSTIAVPEIAVGLADLVSGGRAGKFAEEAGFKPKQAKEFISDFYSPEQKLANQKVQEADGFIDTAKTALQYPSTIFHTTLESLGGMGVGGLGARGLMAVAPKVAPFVAGAIGEGLVTAGQNAEQLRQETDDGLLTGKQAAITAGSGALTGLISGASGSIAKKLGIADIDTLIAEGKLAGKATGLPKAIAGGVISEGLLEEMPQSAQEQIAQNLSLDKPWDEGVGNAAAMGALSGGLMGGGANALNAFGGKDNTQVTPPPAPPAPEGSLTSAATIAQAVGLTPQPVMPDATEAKPNIVDSLNAVEAQQNGVMPDTAIAPIEPATIAPEQAAEKQIIDEQAQQAATSPLNDLPQPTEKQVEAGNYKKGHIKYDGLNITVENPQGSTRSGVDEDGATWENTLANHYGYIKRTKGNDGDNLDVFVGDKPANGKVFVINQTKKDGSFDEHKAVLGAETADEAIAIYKANYADDWNGGKSVTELTTPAFKDWLKNGDPTKPLETVSATNNDVDMTKVAVGEQVDVGGVPYVKTENGFERVTSATNNVVNATSVDTVTTLPERVDETANGVQMPAIRKGEVGGMLAAQEVVTTASGRTTTPFPKFNGKDGKVSNFGLKAVDKWLVDNAIAEAESRNDDFNLTQFKAINLKNLSQADKDGAEEYLFGSQPEVVPSILKPLVTETAITPENVNAETTSPVNDSVQPTDTVRPLVEELTKLRATADKHPSFDPALKAAKDFMAGKKVSPKQFKNFANLLGKKNKAFREVLMQLHDQAASTPEQLAAKEKKSKLAKAMLEERMKLDTTKDGLMQAMAKLGGLNTDKAKAEFGIDPADMRQHGAGIKRSFNKNGLDADTMRELLLEQGYPVGESVADLGNAIADAMSGIDVLTPAGQEALAQKKYEEYANGIDELSDDEQALLDELVTKATAKYGAEALAEIDASLAESMKGQPQAEIERALLRMLKEEFDDETGNAGTSQATEGQAGQDTETGSTENGSGRAQQDGADIEGQGSNASQVADNQQEDLKAKAKAIIEKVLDSKDFVYNSELNDALGALNLKVNPTSSKETIAGFGRENYAAQQEIENRLKDTPFGTWETLVSINEDYKSTKVFVSNGIGNVDSRLTIPKNEVLSLDDVQKVAIEDLAYLLRKEVESERSHRSNKQALADNNFFVGQNFKGFKSNSGKVFNATISSIDNNAIKLFGIIRGSSKRYELTLPPSELANALVKQGFIQPVQNSTEAPALELTGQTNEDINAGIAAQEAEARAQQEQTKADEASRIEAERKSRQEIAADSFDLTQTGKDAKSTKANDAKVIDNQFAGQGDLLSQPTEQPKSETKQANNIQDLGEKIGGARKDTAVSTGTKSKRTDKNPDVPTWAKRYKITEIVYSSDEKENGTWVINDSREKDRFGQTKVIGRGFASQEAAMAELPALVVGAKHRVVATAQRPDGTYGYEIYRSINDRKRVKIVDKVFDDRIEALTYMGEHAAEILETNTTFGEVDLPTPDDTNRVGVARRNGDVKDTDFMDTFGFRGVEFGEWNNQIERQQVMNAAYDGLLDLAEVLNLPPKALTLNGDLALAFGARGQGLSAAKAHYERDKSVINLTKMNGAGSLAHEFFHALDHYLGRLDGKASSEWVTDSDGTRSFKAKEVADDMVSSGFSYKSNVREEVRAAYKDLMETMFRKATTYVEDTKQADDFVARAKDDLASKLDSIRNELSAQKDPKYYKRNNKPATAEQLAEFDTVAKQLLDGQGLDAEYRAIDDGRKRTRKWQLPAGRHTNDALEKISAIYKAVRGRNGFDSSHQQGTMDYLRGTMSRYSGRLKMLADAQQGNEKVRQVPTDFALNAREMDQGRGSDYWTTPHEMAARAFQGYVEDKIAVTGGKSPFLNYGREGAGILTPWGVKFPFPRGEERKAINAALDKFVSALQTKETDKGIALYQNKEEYGNYGITEKQRSELTEPERRAYDQSAATAIALRGVKNSVLGLAVSKDFKQTGSTSLLGKQIATPEDLAVAAQVYRDPRFETVRYFFIKDGSVISQTSVTSKLAGIATLSPNVNGEGVTEFISEIATEAANLGADGVYLLHNHPDGNPTPSKVDMVATQFIQGILAEKNIDLLGHVIINHQKYAVIDRENNQQVIERKFENTYSNDNPAVPHAILGKVISDQYDLAEHAKAIEFTEGNIVLIGTSGMSGISVITEIEPADLKPLKLAAILRKLSRQSGAESLFAYNVPLNLSNLAAKAIKNSILVDAITTDTYGNKQSLRSFIDPDDNVTMGRPLKGYVVKQAGVNDNYPVSNKEGSSEADYLKNLQSTWDNAKELTDEQARADIDTLFRSTAKNSVYFTEQTLPATIYHAITLPKQRELDLIAKQFGKRIIGFAINPKYATELGKFDGATIENKNVIYLRAGTERTHLALLGHELTHKLREDNPALYNELFDAIVPYAKNFSDFAARYESMDDNEVSEEFVSDVVADGFMSDKFWNALGEHNPSLLNRIVDAVKNLINTIRKKFRFSPEMKPYLTDYNKVMEIAGKAMAKYAKNTDAAFSRPQSKFSQKSTSIDIRDLNAVVANVNQALRGLPLTHVLEDYTKAPAELVADIKRDKAYDAAGAWHNGEIYLFRNNIINTNHALFTMLHESTHEGLRRVFGKDIDATLMGIYLSNKDIKQQADTLRATHKDLSLVASVEEALADMGGNGIKASVMDKLVAFVRNFLRRLGMNLKVSDGEVRAIVTRALDSVKSPSKVTHYTIGSAYSAASSGDQTNTPEFKAWFKDSKVVDADGNPLVVYHGTQSDVNVFEDKNQRQGSYFAKDRKYAELFTEQGTGTGGNVMPVYLSIKNPAKMRDGVSAKLYKELEDQGYDTSVFASYTPDDYWGLFDGDTELADALKAAGYDGVELTEPQTMGAGSESWLAFYPTQVKSAIGNNGDFDPNNPDIRYSRPTPRLSPVVQSNTPNQQWQSPDKSKLDNVIYMLQNKFVDLKRVTQAIQKSGNTIEDRWNPYLLEENFTGRTAKRTKDFLKQELEPLMKSMQARKVEMADFEEYLWARHAEERNIQIAKINPAIQDGGSGMKTQDARDYLANLTPVQAANYQALAAKVDAILKTSRQRLISYGLETPETIAAWEGAYQHYVPLMREDMDNGFGNGSGQGFSVKGNASKRATGSKRAVVDVLANIAQQVERNIIRGEKNRVSTALVGLATLNPNKDFWKVDVVPKMRTVVAGKNTYEVLYNGSVVQTFTNPVEANKFIQWNGAGYTMNVVKGKELVMDVPDPSYKNRDNIVVARIVNAKGKIEEHFVEFNTHDERAMRAAASIKNLDQDQIGELLGTASSITRYFSSINTQYNPFFGVINILRDVQGSLLNLSSTPLAGKQLDVLKNTPLALKGIYQDIRSERKTGTPTNSYWSLLFEDFQKQGGQTGYRDMFRNAKERGEALKHALDPTWWQQTTAGKIVSINGILAKPEQFLKEAGQKYIFDWLSDYNESMENAVRLSAYKVGLDNGMTKAQAASLAKNISVNFNRKGEMGRQIGSLYAFFNASVQGTARIGETLFTDNNGKLTLSKAGKAIVTGGLLLGVMQALMLAAAGFGDDEPPEFVRDRNLIIPLGNGKAITIAMPLGFNALPAFGRILTEWALSGGEDTSKRFFHIFEMLAEVTNPIGNAGLSMQTITPTMFDPLAALAENKDWTGRPIAKMDFNSQKPTAGHTRAKDTASAISKGLSWLINEATGGSDYTPGALSPTPDQIDYLLGQIFGGVGREYMKLEQSATSIVTGEDLPVYKIPLVGRFYLDAEGQSSQSSRFYDNLKSVFETETELKGLRKDGLDTSEYRANHREAALVFRANLEQREISKMYKLRSEKLKADASPEEIKALNERITARMLKFNELFKTRTTAGE